MSTPAKVLRGQRNQCAACRQYFARNSGFTKHRIGTFGVDRRCLTVPELQERGFQRDVSGFWRVPSTGTNPWSRGASRAGLATRQTQEAA